MSWDGFTSMFCQSSNTVVAWLPLNQPVRIKMIVVQHCRSWDGFTSMFYQSFNTGVAWLMLVNESINAR
jgi:hypothetical protein